MLWDMTEGHVDAALDTRSENYIDITGILGAQLAL